MQWYHNNAIIIVINVPSSSNWKYISAADEQRGARLYLLLLIILAGILNRAADRIVRFYGYLFCADGAAHYLKVKQVGDYVDAKNSAFLGTNSTKFLSHASSESKVVCKVNKKLFVWKVFERGFKVNNYSYIINYTEYIFLNGFVNSRHFKF